ncbi:NUDIX domain-containing protein [Paenibacillus sp. GCM10027626]|uniref:NUDIX domain-containing protein n=1 Tax=Paenibacillus sp. GCM10027626 TaxID=3273411 RepID=UPI00363E5214
MSNKLIGAAAIIIDSAGKILLVKHSYGKCNWEIPGGKSEPGESAEETAQREVFEETGLTIQIEKLTGVYYEPQYDMHHFVFLCRMTTEQQPQPASAEILECGYFSLDDLPRPMSDFTYRRIQEALDSHNKDLFHTIGPRAWME